jgi:hypothetical protein
MTGFVCGGTASMKIRLSRQAVTQAVLSIVLLTLLCVAFVARPQHFGSPREEGAQRVLRPFGSGGREDDDWPEKLAGLGTLPAYRDAERSLGDLSAARADLLQAAAAGDPEATFVAGMQYQWTLEEVRAALAKLGDHLDPAEYRRCLQELLTPHTEAELGAAVMPESRLGILPRVSILPEENLP